MAAVEVTTEPVESRDANTKMIGINGSQEVARYDASALVDGPASAADGGIVRFDGTTGKLLKADTTGVVTAEIADDAVTYAKLQNISATDRLLGRDTSGAGNAEELTVGGGLEFTGSGGVQRSALTGDVTASAGSNTTTIAANAVTNAKLATIATQRVKGRATAGTGAVEDVTISQLLDWLGSTQGSILYRGASAWTVLAPGGSGTLLKSNGSGADPSWGTVVGTGDVVGPASATDGALCRFDGTTGKLVKVDAVGIATAEIASGAVTTAKITDANVTYAKIQNVSATSRLLGRVTAGAGVVEELAPATARTLLAIDGTQEWTLWAGQWVPQATNGASRGIAYMATNLQPVETLDFDTTTQEFAVTYIKLPKRWNLGTLSFQPIWTAASGSGGVVWALEAVAVSDGETLDAAYGTAQTSTDTLSTVNYLHVGPASSAITAAGTAAAGDVLCLRIKRVPADGSDTLAADAKLLGAIVTWTSSAGNDA